MYALFGLLVVATSEPELIILRNATLMDGSGQAAVVGSLAIRGDRIVSIGQFGVQGPAREIDATGLVVAPGFIDLHTHNDSPLQAAATRANKSYATQGVTTSVTGNCGSGPADVAAYYKKLEANGVGCNVAHL